MSKKILIIAGSMPCDTPFLEYYVSILKGSNIEYELICWNRKGWSIQQSSLDYYVWNVRYDNYANSIKKIFLLYRYSRFCKKRIKDGNYSNVIVLTIPISLFLVPYLTRYYSNRFILDIRDHCPAIDKKIFKNWFIKELNHASRVVISSDGFKKWLPDSCDYVISHNVTLDVIEHNLKVCYDKSKTPIRILTAGLMIRYECNARVIRDLANRNDFKLSFVGEGPMRDLLEKYCSENGFANVSFSGRYEKTEEESIFMNSDMVNIYLSQSLNSDTCMSNRFYNSVLYRKPMIVNEGCYQADLVDKFGLGIVLKDQDDFYRRITEYWETLDWKKYQDNCEFFLFKVRSDIETFNRAVIKALDV